MFAGKKSAQIREILISESAWEEMTCLFAPSLERQLGITLERIDEKNPDGIGTHLRYRFSCRGDVLKVITHVNHLANINDHNGLSQQEIADILKLYPNAFNAV